MKFIFFEAQKTAEILHDFDEIYVKCILEKEILQNDESFSRANLQNGHVRFLLSLLNAILLIVLN